MSILSNRLVYLMMTIVVIFWGVSWPIGSIVAGEFGPNVFTAAFIRFSIALPALFLIVKLKEGSLSIPRDLHRNVALLGFMQITLYNFMYLSGLRFTSSSDASLIIAINPTLTALFASRIYEDERFSVKRVIGLIFAFSGVLLIFLESPNEAVPNRLLGNTLIFMGALIWSLYTTFSRPIYQQISPLKFQLWASFYGWVALGIISLTEEPWKQNYTSEGILGLVYLGLFAAALANTLFSTGIKQIGPTQTSIFVNMVPVVGVLSSVLIVGDAFSILYIIAFGLIVIGVRTVNTS